MIGFGTDDDWEDAPPVAKDSYNLWRLMIDEKHQGKGYGTAAMRLILDWIRSEPCGPAECCWLSYEPENERAKKLYAAFGFRETGAFDGEEAIAVLYLHPENAWKETADRFAAGSAAILGAKLAGIYLHGSAAMGCFQPEKSDLDLVTVTHEALTEAEKRAYMDMVVQLDAEGPAKGIEMSVVTKDVCDPFVYPTPFLLHYSRMHADWYRKDPEDYVRRMNGADPDLAAHFTVIRNRGVCLRGLPVSEVFGEVPEEDYLDAILGDVSGAREKIAANPMYLILNLTRVLGYLKERKILSKREGGLWGLERLPERYRPLIRSALEEYAQGVGSVVDPALSREYAAFMLERIAAEGAERQREAAAEPDSGDR